MRTLLLIHRARGSPSVATLATRAASLSIRTFALTAMAPSTAQQPVRAPRAAKVSVRADIASATFASPALVAKEEKVRNVTSIKRGVQELLATHLDVETEELMGPGTTKKKSRTIKKQPGVTGGAVKAEAPIATSPKKEKVPRKTPKKKPSVQEDTLRVKREAPKQWETMLRIIQEQSEERDTTVEDAVGCAFYIYNEAKYTHEPHIWRFQMLVLGMISSLTKDRINGEAVGRLINREGGLTVQSMIDIDEEELAQLVYPAGLYRNKAKLIKKTALVLKKRAEKLGIDVIDIPETYDEVIALPGVGPKIADLVMTVAWHQVRGVCVDSHVHRISNRLGWVDTWSKKNPKLQDPTKTAQELEDWLPKEYWGPINVQVVSFGQTFCKAVAPRCKECPMSHLCPSANSSDI